MKAVSRFIMWWKMEFKVLDKSECEKNGLTFSHNIYGDMINYYGCRSIWRKANGKPVRCHQLIK